MAGRSKVVEPVAPAQVPDLVHVPTLDIGAEDVALPRIHIGQFMSKAVQEDLVAKGCVYSALGQEDGNPVTLDRPVRFHVLNMHKGKSFTESQGAPLQRFAFDDPDAPSGAWVTYDYTIALPAVDEDVPYKLLLTKTGRPAAQQVNMLLVRNAVSGPPWNLAFDLDTRKRENDKGTFWVPSVVQVEPEAAHVEIAGRLAVMLSSSATEVDAGTGSHPDI